VGPLVLPGRYTGINKLPGYENLLLKALSGAKNSELLKFVIFIYPKLSIMKIAKQLPAVLLGLVFFVFGLAHFIKFMPPPPPMEGDMATFFTLFSSSGYLNVIKVLEVVIGILLLIPKTRALGLLLIAPIAVNILLFELLIAKAPGIGVALVLLVLVGIFLNRDKYRGIIT
jgi:putative oxidoreductase